MTWDKLDRLTEPTRLWSLLVGVAAVFAFRFAFDATEANAVGWASFALLWVLMLALAVLCIARVILLIRNSQQAWHAGEPVASERAVAIWIVSAALVIRVLRGDGTGDLDTVLFVAQLITIAALLAIVLRRVVRMVLGRSDFGVWPWFWLSVFISMGVTRLPQSTALEVVVALSALSALLLLLVGIYNAIRRGRRPE